MEALGRLIKSCKSLHELSLVDNNISDRGIEILGYHLKDCSNLESLYLHHNIQITDDSMPVIRRIIETTNIIKLECSLLRGRNLVSIAHLLINNISKVDSVHSIQLNFRFVMLSCVLFNSASKYSLKTFIIIITNELER